MLSVPQGASVVVGGNLTLLGTLSGGGQLNATVVTLGPNSAFTLVLPSPPAAAQAVLSTVVVAASSSLTGTFAALGAVSYTGSNANCYSFGAPTQSASSTALTVTVTVAHLCGSGLSTAAIIGIAVGCSVALLLVVGIWLGRLRWKQTQKMKLQIAQLKKDQELDKTGYQRLD